jgi:hypothetical protein
LRQGEAISYFAALRSTIACAAGNLEMNSGAVVVRCASWKSIWRRAAARWIEAQLWNGDHCRPGICAHGHLASSRNDAW